MSIKNITKTRTPKSEARRVDNAEKIAACAAALRISFGISDVEGCRSATRLLSEGRKPQVVRGQQ
jgi:hypothetical protein